MISNKCGKIYSFASTRSRHIGSQLLNLISKLREGLKMETAKCKPKPVGFRTGKSEETGK